MENYIFNSQEYIEYVDLDSLGRIEFIEDYWMQKKDNDLLYVLILLIAVSYTHLTLPTNREV